MAQQKIAYWENQLGEEMSSPIFAEFTADGVDYIVVHDWRWATDGHGKIVLRADYVGLERHMETPR